MKNYIMLILIMVLLSISYLLAQDTWLQTYDPFEEVIFSVEDVIICSDGGYAVNGTCIDLDTTINWGFVLKTDSEGNMLWAKKDTVDFQVENESRAFVETEDGGFLSASYCWVNGTTLIKRNSNGEREESILLEDIAINIMYKTVDGNIVLAGHNYVNYQTDDEWPCLIKINQNLDIEWSKIYEFENYEWGNIHAVIRSIDEGYLLTGVVRDSVTEDAVLVIKTDANGDSLWTRIMDETTEDDKGKTIIETEEGDIIVGGYLEGITAGFLWKLDCESNTIWLETGTESCGYGFTSFAKSSDNSIVSIFGDLVFDNSLRKFDNDYNIEWTNNLPYYSGHGDKAVKIGSEDNIVIALYYPSYVSLIKLNSDGTDIDKKIFNYPKISLSNYPNPFNPETTIKFELPFNITNPILEIFNIKGQLVGSVKLNENQNSIQWNAKDYSSGIYFYHIKSDNQIFVPSKMVLLK